MPLQKKKKTEYKKKHKDMQDTIQMLTENSLFSTSENRVLPLYYHYFFTKAF